LAAGGLLRDGFPRIELGAQRLSTRMERRAG
jgi:hypothetical protein